MYPFKNSTFDELAAEYIPVINKLHPESKIRDLFEKGKDFNIPKYQRRFGDRLVIIDGNNFVTNPGEELRKIEQKFSDKESWFLEPNRFKKRDDGHYEGIKVLLSLIQGTLDTF